MAQYELTFELSSLDEPQEDYILDELDGSVATYGDLTLGTFSSEGATAVEAVVGAVARLDGLGVDVRRLYEDLVTRSTIAKRCGKTAQAVGLWVRGERHENFPSPYIVEGGGLYLWSEVSAWLAAQGICKMPTYPSRTDYALVNGWLGRRGRSDVAVDGWHDVASTTSVAANIHGNDVNVRTTRANFCRAA